MEWLPIDSAPKDGTVVDLWDGEQRVTDCWFEGWSWLVKEDGVAYTVGDNPTHWMPLPSPPN